MSQSPESKRPDPLIDAYRQASVREGARASANVRAAVLAHARVVAQSANNPGALVSLAGSVDLTDATRSTPAANESRPIWRLAAGVVIGLVGVWIFQLTRPATAPDATVAAASATAEPRVAAAPPSPPAAAAPEATVAVVAPPIAKGDTGKPTSAALQQPPPAALPEQNLALATAPTLGKKADRPSAYAGGAAAAVTAVPAVTAVTEATEALATAVPASAAETSVAAFNNEVVVASAEMRKSAKAESRAEPSSAARAMPTPPPAASPNAFPVQASDVAVAAAPAPRPAPAAIGAPWQGGTSGATAKRGMLEPGNAAPAAAVAQPRTSSQRMDTAPLERLSESELAMFRAVRSSDINTLRAAIARGVNVNVKDDRGSTALQIARERADLEVIRMLETAGAR